MTPRERVMATLAHRVPDRVPRFEIWIDALFGELGQSDPTGAYVRLGQDCVLMPTQSPAGSSEWGTGVDEWGRVWQNGMYVGGMVDSVADLHRYSRDDDFVGEYFDEVRVREVQSRYGDHCHMYGSHIGPFTAAYLAMGLERFFCRLVDDPPLVSALLEDRTRWCIAMFRKAVSLGADVLVLGDDAAHRHGPMISPQAWRELVLPLHRRIVESVDVPVIWHSDGNVERLLPCAIEAGFAGVHGLEPASGMDLAQVKQRYGHELVLVGNADVQTLCGCDLEAVRHEVRRCIEQGAPEGSYMLATCNSIFEGMNPRAVAEFFRYSAEVGRY